MASAKGSLRSDLGRVRGLGSAKEGVQHWWMQRVTAIALIPLSLWFVACIVFLIDVDRATALQWLGSPVTLGLMSLFLVALVYHAVLENLASEHAARMVAMKSASDNATKAIDTLTLIYNKARQAAITQEISEIVGGAAAV